MKTFTLAEMFDAIEKNGLPKVNGWFFEWTGTPNYVPPEATDSQHFLTDNAEYINGKISGACAMGQAFINLGVTPSGHTTEWKWPEINLAQEKAFFPRLLKNEVGVAITNLNDSGDMAFKDIADTLREQYKDYLDVVIEAPEFDYSSYL